MWEQIRSNRIRSMFVVSGMGVLLVAMGVAIGAMFSGGVTSGGAIFGGLVAVVLWLIMWMVSVSSGDQVLLHMAGAREIEKRDHPQLFNIVEEMTIASALGKMPRVFIVEDPSPNAFAAGRKPENAVVAVTTGLLRILDRDELQGVIAHEIGHIKNRDVALMTTAGVMLGCIVLLAEIGMRMMWFGGHRRSRTSNEEGAGQAVVVIVAIIFMILAPILAQLIYFALSRRREYLADASGAYFTRYPEGLASALEKLGGGRAPLADESRVTAPMYIVAPLRKAAGGGGSMLSTHPPLQERIQILRSMSGGAGFQAYEQAYSKVKRGGSLMGARTLAAGEAVEAREGAGDTSGRYERGRTASDAFLQASGYDRYKCGCGAVLKAPPEVLAKLDGCPRCGQPVST